MGLTGLQPQAHSSDKLSGVSKEMHFFKVKIVCSLKRPGMHQNMHFEVQKLKKLRIVPLPIGRGRVVA